MSVHKQIVELVICSGWQQANPPEQRVYFVGKSCTVTSPTTPTVWIYCTDGFTVPQSSYNKQPVSGFTKPFLCNLEPARCVKCPPPLAETLLSWEPTVKQSIFSWRLVKASLWLILTKLYFKCTPERWRKDDKMYLGNDFHLDDNWIHRCHTWLNKLLTELNN